MNELTLILRLSDPTGGVVQGVLEDETSSDGERIERLLGIFGSIWEVADAWEKSEPRRVLSPAQRARQGHDLGTSDS